MFWYTGHVGNLSFGLVIPVNACEPRPHAPRVSMYALENQTNVKQSDLRFVALRGKTCTPHYNTHACTDVQSEAQLIALHHSEIRTRRALR